MGVIQEFFNNREIAIGIWVIIGLAVILPTKPARQFIKTAIPILFCKKFVIFYIVFLSFLGLVLFALNWAGFWDLSTTLPFIERQVKITSNQTRAKFYVACTRAKHSVVFAMENPCENGVFKATDIHFSDKSIPAYKFSKPLRPVPLFFCLDF